MGVPPRGEQLLPFEENPNDDQAPINPHPLIDSDVSSALLHIDQAIITQAQVITI